MKLLVLLTGLFLSGLSFAGDASDCATKLSNNETNTPNIYTYYDVGGETVLEDCQIVIKYALEDAKCTKKESAEFLKKSNMKYKIMEDEQMCYVTSDHGAFQISTDVTSNPWTVLIFGHWD